MNAVYAKKFAEWVKMARTKENEATRVNDDDLRRLLQLFSTGQWANVIGVWSCGDYNAAELNEVLNFVATCFGCVRT